MAPTAAGTALARILSPLGAGPTNGYVATGRAILYTPGGEMAGRVSIEVWGSRHCSLTIDLALGQRIQETVSTPRFSLTGPGATPLLLPPGGLANNCDLLPQSLSIAGLASGASDALDEDAQGSGHRYLVQRSGLSGPPAPLTLDVDPASGRALRAQFIAANSARIEDDYSAYRSAGSVSYPSHIEKRVDGSLRLVIDIYRFSPHAGFTGSDFPTPRPQVAGGANQGGL
jgi:hypothetical protein